MTYEYISVIINVQYIHISDIVNLCLKIHVTCVKQIKYYTHKEYYTFILAKEIRKCEMKLWETFRRKINCDLIIRQELL